jgi:hypothetical protein
MNDGASDGVGLWDGGNDGATLTGFLLVFFGVGDDVICLLDGCSVGFSDGSSVG